MSRLSTLAALIVSLVICGSPFAQAVGFQPVVQEELSLQSEPLAPGAAAIILYRQVDRNDNGLTSHEDNYIRIKVLKEEGRKQADVEIPFFKEVGNIVNIHARTIKPDGSIANFDGKVYEKYIVKAKGTKFLAKTFTLPDVQIGSILEYFYTLDLSEHLIFDSHWILSQELFTRKAQFSLKPYESTYSPINLRWSWSMLPAGTEPPKQGPDKIVRMAVSNVPAFQTEDYMPPENELKSRVNFIYEEGFPDKDPDQFWKRIGKKRNGDLENFIGKRKAMEQAVAQIVSPNDSPETKLRKIYDRVQQVRNMSYEVSKTEQESKRAKEKPPQNVEEVWKRGYGSGGDLTWLFLALVRATGIEAYGCWVSDRREYFFNPKLEQDGTLNANVVLVKLDGKDLYLDPGAAFTPFGLLTWSETGTQGLRLDKDGGSWIRTTLPMPAESQSVRSGKLTISETGDLEGKLKLTYSGLQAMYRRLDMRNEDEVTRKKYLEDEVKEQIPAAAEVDLTSAPDWKNSGAPLVAEFDLKIPGWVGGAGKRALLPVGIFSAPETRTFEHANRVYPIYIEYPYEKIDDITIDLPLGWQVNSTPAPQVKDAKAILYSLKVENDKGTLHLSRKFTLDFLLLDQKYYPTLRSFFQMVRTGDEQQVILLPAGSSASN